jgi:hypothetical protein
MAKKGDTPEDINRMQQEVFQVFAEARSLEDLRGKDQKLRGSIENIWTSWAVPMSRSWLIMEGR